MFENFYNNCSKDIGNKYYINLQVCVVTLQLFETLVSLNMEDVMLSLVFRHLISCNFLVPSFRSRLNYADPHGRAAYKFLSLVPVSCDPPATPLTPRRTPFFQSPSSGPTSLPHSSHVQVVLLNFLLH